MSIHSLFDLDPTLPSRLSPGPVVGVTDVGDDQSPKVAGTSERPTPVLTQCPCPAIPTPRGGSQSTGCRRNTKPSAQASRLTGVHSAFMTNAAQRGCRRVTLWPSSHHDLLAHESKADRRGPGHGLVEVAVDGFAHVAAQVVCVVAVCGCQTRGWCTSKMISVVATPLPPCAPSHGCPHQAIRGSSMTSPASRSRYRAQDSMSARRFSIRSERASACSTTLPTL